MNQGTSHLVYATFCEIYVFLTDVCHRKYGENKLYFLGHNAMQSVKNQETFRKEVGSN
jgi:hypothetical protein